MEGDRDAELYLAACEGDRDAVVELVDRRRAMLPPIARALGVREPDVLDVVQLVWCAFFEHLKDVSGHPERRLPGPDPVRTWLVADARRTVDGVRRKGPPVAQVGATRSGGHAAGEGSEGGAAAEPARDPDETAMRTGMLDGLSTLDPECRAVVALSLADPPIGPEEIGNVLDLPSGTVESTRDACLEKLAARLGPGSAARESMGSPPLLDMIRRAVHAPDDSSDAVVASLLAAYDLTMWDAPIAVISEDTAAAGLSPVRSADGGEVRFITCEAEGVLVQFEIEPARVIGTIDPPRTGRVIAQQPHTSMETAISRFGSFEVPLGGTSPFRLVVWPDDRSAIATEWVLP